MAKLLEVKNLKTFFYTDDGIAKAVDDVSYDLDKGETLGLVGESGCGKSVSALSIMRLIPDPPGKIVGGEIIFKGEDLVQKSEREMQDVRGNDIAMIFQEPMTSLNPVFKCGMQIDEAVILHQNVSKEEAKKRSIEMLRLVGIPGPEQRYEEYPHQLSGGLRQRVMIAMALSCNPEILIADEPTTALDVTVQAQILELIKKLQKELGMAVIMITHDLGVIAEICDRVAVMYASKIAEYSNADEVFYNPKHPYTLGLLNSIPKLNKGLERLKTIEGSVPPATGYPVGCHFVTRCKYADSKLPADGSKCWSIDPPLEQVDDAKTMHTVACHFWREIQKKRLELGDRVPLQEPVVK
jgi:oligopeptide/dipeptide ABC transporter ATP-binding protein